MNYNPISEITGLKNMGVKSSFAICLTAAALMFIFTRYLIPWLSKTTRHEIILFWFIQGIGWSLFHITFGWQLLLTLIPLIFILSWTVQKTKNSWVGVIIHGGLNGPTFLAISFGLI